MDAKIGGDTQPSSKEGKCLWGNNRIKRNFSYEANSSLPHSHIVPHLCHSNLFLHCWTQSPEILLLMDLLSHSFTASKASSDTKHSLIFFSILRTNPLSPLEQV